MFPEARTVCVIAPVPPPELNVTVTAWSALIASAHVPVPEQSPLHPVNPGPGVRVTLSVARKTAVHDVVAGDAHVPPDCGATENATCPLPLTDNVSTCVVGADCANVAVTERFALIARAHVPVPEQAPLQPENDQPDGAEAVRVTLSVVR